MSSEGLAAISALLVSVKHCFCVVSVDLRFIKLTAFGTWVVSLAGAMEYYKELGTQSDLREPHRIPQQFLSGLFEKEAPAVAPVPVIAFINSRSGGHAGPALSAALYRALGSTQVRWVPFKLVSFCSIRL